MSVRLAAELIITWWHVLRLGTASLRCLMQAGWKNSPTCRAEQARPCPACTHNCSTLDYMAPELIRHEKKCTSAVDIFSFGALLHELCTGARQGCCIGAL